MRNWNFGDEEKDLSDEDCWEGWWLGTNPEGCFRREMKKSESGREKVLKEGKGKNENGLCPK